MKVIFLNDNISKLKMVFDTNKVLYTIGCNLNDICFTKNDVLKRKREFDDVEVIFSTWYMPQFTQNEIVHIFPNLKAVFYAAGTVKYFAEPFLENGIKIFQSGQANGIAVAEFTVAQILLANKGYFQAQRIYKSPLYRYNYNKAHSIIKIKPGNYEATVGIIGVGAIGSYVVELLRPYNLRVLISDPAISKEEANEWGTVVVSLEEIFENSDVISNHLPDIPSTKNLLNYKLFNSMKKGATFINTGRGSTVVEKDLVKALKRDATKCALLDVTGHEPIWPWSPLLYMRNIFLSPHMAGSTGKEEKRLGEYALETYRQYIKGFDCHGEVTKDILYKMT